MHPSTQEQGKTWPKVDKEKWPKKKKEQQGKTEAFCGNDTCKIKIRGGKLFDLWDL